MTVRGGDKLQRKPRELLRTSVDLDGTVIEGELHFIRECSFPCVCAHARARPPKRLAAVQLEALTADGQRLTAWPSSSSTREAKRLTHGRLRGAYLQLPAPEALRPWCWSRDPSTPSRPAGCTPAPWSGVAAAPCARPLH